MPKLPENWPAGVLPRGLDIGQAAAYVGLSPGTFQARIAEGRYPGPRRDGKRMIWDKADLDDAMDRLAGRSAKIGADNVEEEAMHAMMQRRLAARSHG